MLDNQKSMPLKNQVQLIAYPNRIGSNLSDLADTLENDLAGAVGGVHILPMYPSNADAGFAPLTHKEVDPAYGNWDDIRRISQSFDLCVDVTLNHISDESPEFKDFIAKGQLSRWADIFVDIEKLGPITKEDLSKIHIRKEKEPFREVTLTDGRKVWVWTTFTENQIDLNYDSPKTFELMEDYMTFLMDQGVNLFRLDAFGYITKKIGTSCFLLEPETYDRLEWFNNLAQSRGAEILPEVHDHPSYQYAISSRDMYAYGFALPPLVLYTYLQQNTEYLKNWLRNCPAKMVTVLDTHDGICMPDVEGIIPEPNLKKLIESLESRSGDTIMRRMAGNLHSVGAIYQVTCTFFDALKQNADAYIGSRAIQFFTPGIPQVYYVGLVAGENDHDLSESTGESRDINRHFYGPEEWQKSLAKPITKRLLKLMRFRNSYPAFDGTFALHTSTDTELMITWKKNDLYCRLDIDVIRHTGSITYFDEESKTEKKFEI